jgi:hypothetical protein
MAEQPTAVAMPLDDQPVLPPDQIDEMLWGGEGTPPVDRPPVDNSPPINHDEEPTLGTPAPPMDEEAAPASATEQVRVQAMQEVLEQDGALQPEKIMIKEGWISGMVAAGLAGTVTPEFTGAAKLKRACEAQLQTRGPETSESAF